MATAQSLTAVAVTPDSPNRGRARPILGVMTAPCAARAKVEHPIQAKFIFWEYVFRKIWKKSAKYCQNWPKVAKKIAKIDRNFTENGKSWRFYRKNWFCGEKKGEIFPIVGGLGNLLPSNWCSAVTHRTLPPNPGATPVCLRTTKTNNVTARPSGKLTRTDCEWQLIN